jgi:hypothetical protein
MPTSNITPVMVMRFSLYKPGGKALRLTREGSSGEETMPELSLMCEKEAAGQGRWVGKRK